MSYQVILGPRELHNVRTADDYRALHRRTLARRAASGQRVRVQVSLVPVRARVDVGNWIVDCACGAGNATDPEWGVACCFGCGAVHEQVVFPEPAERVVIERLLVARPQPANRFWSAGETVAQLQADNVAHGVRDALD